LVAELTAAFLCAALSIPSRLRHAEYLGSWLAILKADTKAIFTAANKATEAAQYLEAAGGVAGEGDVEEAA
jgi:antirestriction protein ArdC